MKYEPAVYLKNINRKYKLIENGEDLVKNKKYSEAEDFYLNLLNHELFANDYYPYFKLSQIYHHLDDLKNQKSIVVEFFKSNIYCEAKKLKYFKNIVCDEDLVKNYEKQSLLNKDLSYLPVLPAGGMNKFNFTNLPNDYKLNKDFIKFDENISVEDKIKFKYKLIKRGDDLISKKNYPAGIDYFTKLFNHPLFVNDAYPYFSLSLIFKKLKQSYDETMVILEFFKCDFYCDDDLYEYFKSRLSERDSDKITKKTHEAHVPLPQSRLICEYYQNLKSDEKTIVEALINEIPEETVVNYIDYGDVGDDFEDDSDILKFTSLNQIDLEERILMINIVNVVKTGVTQSQAAEIVGCNVHNLYKWFKDGKKNKSINTFYFHSQLFKIDSDRKNEFNHSDKYKSVNSKSYKPEMPNDYVLYDGGVSEKTLNSLNKFEEFINSSEFFDTVKQYGLTSYDIEIVKNRLLDSVIEKKDCDDFLKVVNEICKYLVNVEFALSDDEFDSYFMQIDTATYTENTVFEAKLKTIKDYNSHKINKSFIKSRFKYYLKKIFIEKTQLSRLSDIKKNPNTPQNKRYLSKDQLKKIHAKAKDIILSQYGFSGNILDYIRYLVEIDISQNKKEAVEKFKNIINRDELAEILNSNEKFADDFINQFLNLINKSRITSRDINRTFIKKLALNFLPSRRIIMR